MVAVARERMEGLMSMASVAKEAPRATRYVSLARRIGTRYNVKMPRSMKMTFCKSCSAFMGSGTGPRVRLNQGRLTRTCPRCGRVTRMGYSREPRRAALEDLPGGREKGAIVAEESGDLREEEEENE